MDVPSCPGCQALQSELQRLQKQLAELTQKLDASQRAGKRQAAPFRKGPPKAPPKPPGRKSGDAHGRHGHRPPPPPEQIHECHEALLPESCPHCHGTLVETDVAEQFQTEIPRQPIYRKFHVHLGRCTQCGQRAQGRHPLQTSDALGAAASQVGPDAQAAATSLHTQTGLSHGKVAQVFDELFGIDLTRGASAQINLRSAQRLTADYQTILDDLKLKQRLAVDETGWRVGGHSAWLHVWVGERATAYAIDPQRSAEALERVIGRDWSGVLSHDGYSTYDRFTQAVHQSCVAHVLRRAQELLEVAQRGAVRFPRQVIGLFQEAVHQRNEYLRGVLPLAELQAQRDAFEERLLNLVMRPRQVADYARFAKHLRKHFDEWFAFLADPAIEATNWLAEQAVRPAVVNRKVWGGNRTEAGAAAQGVLMSVIETVRRSSRSVVDYVSQALRSYGNGLAPRPIILPGR
jgi:transposase